MQVWLFVFGALACMGLTGALPVKEEKAVGMESADHHINKRQLEILNTFSGDVCATGVPQLESLLEDLSLPSTGDVYDYDVRTVDIDECDVTFSGGLTSPSIRIMLSDIYIRVTGKYKKKWGWFTFRGSWEVKIYNGLLDVDATTQIDLEEGRVTQIDVNSCRDDFTDVRVRTYGSFSAWVLNLFRGSLSRRLSEELEDKVCEVGVPYLENDLL